MRLLYINNFRGFNKTLIPIHKVNFLVGENSTGKTSILKLIKLISDETFKYTFEFYSPVIDLGRFEDIVNKTDSSGNFFEIGMMLALEKKPNSNPENPNFLALTYQEVNEKIKLTKIRYLCELFETTITINNGKFHYQFIAAPIENEITIEKLTPLFFDWCTNPTEFIGRRKLFKSDPHRFYASSPRYAVMRIMELIIDTFDKKKKNIEYSRIRLHGFFDIIEDFFPRIRWIAPIRAEPKRIYEHMETKESIDGSHAPQVLRDILLGSNAKTALEFKVFLDKFGKHSHMFDEIRVKKFGDEKFAPFEIQIILEGKPYSISNVGYGVSQVLPLLLEVFDKKNVWMAIQQPEVHLHPRAQAEFGELLFNSANETNKVFFIETHSDFTLDRFRHCIRNHESTIDSQVLFFHRSDKINNIEIIPIDEDGSYWSNCSNQFRDFFINESIKLLGI